MLFFLFTHGNFTYLLNTDFRKNGPQIHVFIDVATGPSLLQLIEFIKIAKSPESKKIIAWNRHRNIHKNLPLEKWNAKEISYENMNEDYPYSDLVQRTAVLIKEELKKQPNSRIIIHTNLYHANKLALPLIHMIKPNKIKHLHLYEDGYGNTIASRRNQILKHSFSFFKPSKEEDAWPYYLFQKYPVTYHIAFLKEIKSDPKFKSFNKFFKKAVVTETDFFQIKRKITEKEKKIIAQAFSINPTYYKNMYASSPKPSAFILTPNPRTVWEEKAQTNAILNLLKDKSYFWILKPHPHKNSLKIINEIKKIYPTIMVIENTVPIEAFFLTDSMPDYIAGFSSSTFLSMDPHLFLYYIERINDEYLPFLIKEGKIRPEQVIKLDFKNSFLLHKPSWQEDKRFLPTYPNSDLFFLAEDNAYGKIISFNNNVLRIKWLDKTEEKFLCDKNKVCVSQIHDNKKNNFWNKIKLFFK